MKKEKRKGHLLIDKMEAIRVNNNHLWMKILHVAWEHAPKKTAKIFDAICKKDRKISEVGSRIVQLQGAIDDVEREDSLWRSKK